jgi:NDP-mannose synthase
VNVVGLIVAGGKGQRMVQSGSTVPKPLVRVRGATLLERNIFALLRAGVTDVFLAVSAQAHMVRRFAESRGRTIGEALNARVSVIAEDEPLGSMGAVAFLRDWHTVLVLNVDNLTSLDLRAMVTDHQRHDAALTLAVHDEAFSMPFGGVVVEAGRVVAYQEKPTLKVPICSAISVLSSRAVAEVRPGERIGLPALANRLLHQGREVRAFYHQAAWIDINDLQAVERAEGLVAAHADELELWAAKPDYEAVAIIASSSRGVAFEQLQDGTWCLPTAVLGLEERPLSTVTRIVDDRLGVQSGRVRQLAVFDDVQWPRKGVTRTRVFLVDAPDGTTFAGGTWIRREETSALTVAPSVPRALAVWPKN